MKDEIKLKDMTDFLKNVYKNIKEQPTLEEEQKQEKEFINKIKGNNTNEIKEIFNIEELFEEWKQFLSWCYENNDKTIEIHRDKLKWTMNYIINLQQENKQLKEENARLKLKPLEGIFAQVDDDMLLRNCGAMQQEIDNYKCILTESEEWLKKIIEMTANLDEKGTCKNVLDKIQELKEKYK